MKQLPVFTPEDEQVLSIKKNDAFGTLTDTHFPNPTFGNNKVLHRKVVLTLEEVTEPLNEVKGLLKMITEPLEEVTRSLNEVAVPLNGVTGWLEKVNELLNKVTVSLKEGTGVLHEVTISIDGVTLLKNSKTYLFNRVHRRVNEFQIQRMSNIHLGTTPQDKL